jgi:hypothetical protein
MDSGKIFPWDLVVPPGISSKRLCRVSIPARGSPSSFPGWAAVSLSREVVHPSGMRAVYGGVGADPVRVHFALRWTLPADFLYRIRDFVCLYFTGECKIPLFRCFQCNFISKTCACRSLWFEDLRPWQAMGLGRRCTPDGDPRTGHCPGTEQEEHPPPLVLSRPGDLHSLHPIRAFCGPGLPSRKGRFRNYVQKPSVFVHGFLKSLNLQGFRANGAFLLALAEQ